ncbi:MAG: glutathione peroxidase [Clostridiales bacterium]|jgi:glutathione peroxidase|nr:glutathione peroxidase [Clostridiales bacterium]
MNIYDFTVKDSNGAAQSLKEYAGKVLLVVNTATKCGLTPQYEGLQAFYEKYKAQGLEILDFPCNQFLSQAPENDAEIGTFCSLNYGTTFPRFAKIDVNGATADPLFVWLKEQAPVGKGNAETQKFEDMVKQYTPENKDADIQWNFGKFLVDRSGNVVARYSPAYKPEELSADVESLL